MVTAVREEVISIVESYVHGLGNGDFSHVPFAPDVTYESPISPKRTGKETIDFLSSLFPIMRGAEIKEHLVEGSTCATIFDLHTEHGTLHIFDRFRVEDGQLKSISPFYDPSPLAGAQTAARRQQLISISEVYFQGMAEKDMSAVPWSDDVVLRGPLCPGGATTPLKGRAAVLEWFAGVLPALGEMRVVEHYVNEDLTGIATRADVGLSSGDALRVVDRFTVDAEGRITEQENHYDPRPALPS